MHLTAQDPRARLYDVIDQDTGLAIPLVGEADDTTGEYTVYVEDSAAQGADSSGRPRLKMQDEGPVFEKRKGNIKLVLKSNGQASI